MIFFSFDPYQRFLLSGNSNAIKTQLKLELQFCVHDNFSYVTFHIRFYHKINGNLNAYQASTSDVDIYNVRFLKIRATDNSDFCLRIELCGEGEYVC